MWGALMKRNLYIDDETFECVGELPGRFSASQVFRHIFKKLFLSDNEWRVYISDSKAKALDAWLVERFEKR
jgi:hypothetical protein